MREPGFVPVTAFRVTPLVQSQILIGLTSKGLLWQLQTS